ncbi:hypothetical protein V8E54_006441 [Elaphomyces granulatus]
MELWSTQWGLDDLKNKKEIPSPGPFKHVGKALWPYHCRLGRDKRSRKQKNSATSLPVESSSIFEGLGAGKLATAQGIQFLAQEGIWRVDKDAVTMTRPGSALRELCRVPEVRDLIGLPTPGSPAKADVLVPIRMNNVVQSIRGHLIKQRYGLDCVEQSEYFLFSRFRLVDVQRGLGKVSSFVSIGETVLRVACILREGNSGIGFLVAEVFEEVSVPEKSLEEQVKRYRSRKQYKLLQPSAVQMLLNVQHACSAGCRIQKNRNAFRREREWISGDKWTHAEDIDEWMVNPYVLR